MERQSRVRLLWATLVLLGGLLVPTPGSADAPVEPKLRVFVSHAGQDALGLSLVQAIADQLSRSAAASSTANRDDADVVLFVSTLDPDAGTPGVVTIAGWSLVYVRGVAAIYIGSGLRVSDRERMPKTAADLAAYVDGLLKARRAELPGSAEWEQYGNHWNEAVEQAAETLPEDACGIKARSAFREELRVALRWSMAANVRLNVDDAIKSAAADYVTDEEFVKKLQSQTSKLAQCQSDLAALKRSVPGIKK